MDLVEMSLIYSTIYKIPKVISVKKNYCLSFILPEIVKIFYNEFSLFLEETTLEYFGLQTTKRIFKLGNGDMLKKICVYEATHIRVQKIPIRMMLNLNFTESLRKCFEEQAFYRLRILPYNILYVFEKIMFFINNSKDVEYYGAKKYNTRNKNGIQFFLMGY